MDDGDDMLEQIHISDLVKEGLEESNKSLNILAVSNLCQALEDYVVRKQGSAIADIVEETLEKTQRELYRDATFTTVSKSSIAEAASKVKTVVEESMAKGTEAGGTKKRTGPVRAVEDSDDEPVVDHYADDDEDDDVPVTSKGNSKAVKRSTATTAAAAAGAKGKAIAKTTEAKGKTGVGKGAKKGGAKSKQDVADFGSEDEEAAVVAKKAFVARPSARAAAVKKSYKEASESEEGSLGLQGDSDAAEEIQDSDEDDDDDEEEEEDIGRKGGRGRGGKKTTHTLTKLTATTAKKPPVAAASRAGRGAGARSKAGTSRVMSDDNNNNADDWDIAASSRGVNRLGQHHSNFELTPISSTPQASLNISSNGMVDLTQPSAAAAGGIALSLNATGGGPKKRTLPTSWSQASDGGANASKKKNSVKGGSSGVNTSDWN